MMVQHLALVWPFECLCYFGVAFQTSAAGFGVAVACTKAAKCYFEQLLASKLTYIACAE